jgi:hypothetical protein
MAYYENGRMLCEHLKRWRDLPPEIANNLHVVVVDDASPEDPAEMWCRGIGTLEWTGAGLASFQLWRMGVDVRWNQDACRNVGVRQAKTPWVLLTDMDHVVPVDTWYALMTGRLRKGQAYRFRRVNAPRLEPYKPHPNSWAMPRRLYWQIGGYDEALAGNYGTDGDFLVRARKHCEVVEHHGALIRYPREVIPDASTTTLERKSDTDKMNVNRICKARAPDWQPLHFSFPCARVL